MAGIGTAGPTPVDLEKELTCSICTDLLYQPLTLLDCLHTFCGACLKEWFAFQASTATSLHPYTCPACRASVRSTQPNATVTTLLDMFIQANPHRGKSEEEKQADREKFKYGDVVMPKLRRRGGQDEEEERRVLEEVQQLSLREVGIDTSSTVANVNHLEPPRERRRRERSEGRRERSTDTRRSADGRSRSRHEPSASSAPREVVPPRVIEHQSSLRSLLSASELDSQEMEEEIMRQIMEEGLLDGIDLNNIDVAQEDEISERIAQAYRRRQEQKKRERRERRERLAREGLVNSSGTSTPEIRSPAVRVDEQQRRRPHTRSTSNTPIPRERDNRPPVSRPGLLDVANQGARTRHVRSASQGSSRSARERQPAALSITSARAHNNSQPELVGQSTALGSSDDQRRQSDNEQRSTLDGRQQFRNSLQAHSASNPNSPRRTAFHFLTATESSTSVAPVVTSPVTSFVGPLPPSTTSQAPASSRRTTDPTDIRQPRAPPSGTPPLASPPTFSRATTDPSVGALRSQATSATAPVAPPTLHPEPHVSCRGCGKVHIEYELHYNCSRCDEGAYNICQACYRRGKGCKHWYGFGWAAWPAYQQKAPPGGYPPNHEYPHIMRGHRFRRPQAPLTETVTPPHALQSEDDPASRLEAGVFCDICAQWANACYWKCDYCNEGEWGYCNDCVNQGRHCTHALLPISHVGKERATTPPSDTAASTEPPSTPRSNHLAPPYSLDPSPPTTPPLTPRSASLISGPGHVTLANSHYRPLTFTTLCNICTYPIPPSHTRYHCMKCNGGDYDICSSCYQKLVLSGRISKEDGMHGWRRCLRGHRMIVVGFEDRDGGQRRVVVRDLVGGFSLRDEAESNEAESSAPTHSDNWTWRDTDGSRHQFRSPNSANVSKGVHSTQRFPPNGGVGLRIQARWGYFPAEGVTDELAFPKFAEITEAEDINGDWYWGVYAGSKGLFPGGYGRVIGGNVEREGRI
ncbi:hypothetical protein BU23DRAFT_554658 [Bimuria novae-zelandiae CBS 107.79]|uniref:RING-type domain-containing protein n=1 Tax=Bimuria novae-zelandiae CBS 107.79 TaxID=1447943 RepID=A0A6A5V9Z1_9PLEO|nr:hypothetical protein BU23DRAFT_554658 [Bimuria novae-zelandiae CBS 107.79]